MPLNCQSLSLKSTALPPVQSISYVPCIKNAYCDEKTQHHRLEKIVGVARGTISTRNTARWKSGALTRVKRSKCSRCPACPAQTVYLRGLLHWPSQANRMSCCRSWRFRLPRKTWQGWHGMAWQDWFRRDESRSSECRGQQRGHLTPKYRRTRSRSSLCRYNEETDNMLYVWSKAYDTCSTYCNREKRPPWAKECASRNAPTGFVADGGVFAHLLLLLYTSII